MASLEELEAATRSARDWEDRHSKVQLDLVLAVDQLAQMVTKLADRIATIEQRLDARRQAD